MLLIRYLYHGQSCPVQHMECRILRQKGRIAAFEMQRSLILMLYYILTGWRYGSSCSLSNKSNKGTEFILGFIQKWDVPYDVKLFISSSSVNTSVNVDYFDSQGLNRISATINRGMKAIVLDSTVEQSRIGISKKGILITSSSPVSVYGLRDPDSELSEAFTVLPTESLSTVYVITSHKPYTNSTFIVVGVQDDTIVTIKLNISSFLVYNYVIYMNEDTIDIHLNRLETFVLDYSADLSGTIITSNRPVSVFSGGTSHIPAGTNKTNTFFQLEAVDYWDTEFIISPLYPRTKSMIKIYAFHPNTSVTILKKTDIVTRGLMGVGFIEEAIESELVVINSSKPISIVQYALGEDHDPMSSGDPLMMIVPGLNQVSSEYMFPTRTIYDFQNYVSVIIQNTLYSGLRLDGSFQAEKIFSLHSKGVDFIVAIKRLTSSFHNLTHIDPAVKFGAVVYGFRNSIGYGFPAGMEFPDRGNCESRTSIVPTRVLEPASSVHISWTPKSMTQASTTVPSTKIVSTAPATVTRQFATSRSMKTAFALASSVIMSSTSPVPMRTASTTVSSVATAISLGTTLVCLSCREMTHLKYCNTVERCKENLGCFVEQFYVENHVRYDAGCIKPYDQRCDNTYHVPGRCTRCCNISYCNHDGCGDNGFASSASRGPLCFDCEHLGDPSECVSIQQCAYGDVCHIDQYFWGENDSVYSMGCRSRHRCSNHMSSIRLEHIIVGRSTPTCSQCCEDDFCNTNCTAPQLTPLMDL